MSALVASTARLGLGRLIGRSDCGSLPPGSRDALRATSASENHVRGTIEGYLTAPATLSTNSEHRTVVGATHSTLTHDVHDSRAIPGAILDVVSSIRNEVPRNR